MATVLSDTGTFDVPTPGGLALSPADTERVTGWTLKPEGMCRDELCVPLTPAMRQSGGAQSGGRQGEGRQGERIDVAAFWRHIGNPVASDRAGETWVLGTGPQERQSALAGLMAPDFALPDLAGKVHRLSDYRGQKVFLTTWASW